MLAYGGQTALNCGVKLNESGILQKYDIKVLGTQVSGIQKAEDRQLFKDSMNQCGIPVLNSKTVFNFDQAKKVAQELGYPVIIRVAYTLGGKGGGVAYNEIELHEIVERGIKASLVGQVLVEEYVGSWKQIEYEVMRDYAENNVIVCNMENVLAMKVHTGDNIVVAPSQTIDNSEYHLLRSASLRATKHVGIVGECNIQFALDPNSERYVAIEVNPRLSRSSALASKATGYPIASPECTPAKSMCSTIAPIITFLPSQTPSTSTSREFNMNFDITTGGSGETVVASFTYVFNSS